MFSSPYKRKIFSKRLLSHFALTLAFTLVLFIVGWTLALRQFGTIHRALSYLRAEPILIDESTKSFGRANFGEEYFISFSLVNITKTPIHILGARERCSCSTVEGLPLVLNPGIETQLRVRLRPNRISRRFEETVVLYTDSQGELSLSVIGEVVPGKPGSLSSDARVLRLDSASL